MDYQLHETTMLTDGYLSITISNTFIDFTGQHMYTGTSEKLNTKRFIYFYIY